MKDITQEVIDINNNNMDGSSCMNYLSKTLGKIPLYYTEEPINKIIKDHPNSLLKFRKIKEPLAPQTPIEILFNKKINKNNTKMSAGGKISFKRKRKTKRKKKRNSCKKRMKKKIICFSANNKKVTKKLLKIAKKIRKTKKINLSRCSKFRLKKWRKTKKK